HRARQDVRADFAAFFEDADAQVTPRPSRQLLQADRGRKPGGSGADDHHVIGHGFALAHPFSFVLSRPEHNSTRTPCQFLDRAVNAGRGKDAWAGKWIRSALPKRAAHWPGGSTRASMSPSRRSRATG